LRHLARREQGGQTANAAQEDAYAEESSMNVRPVAIVLAALSVVGCPGSLELWGVNVPLPGGGGFDDDDDTAPADFSNYDGLEYLNIEWTDDAIAAGHYNCRAVWEAQGPNTLDSDGNLCPECDQIWQMSLSAEDVEDCLGQGTGITAPTNYTRKVGFRTEGGTAFTVYRTRFSAQSPLGQSQNEPLDEAGIGAFQGAEFTWSGIDSPVVIAELGYSFYYSGEGTF
jgi:hypothetical protein